MSLQPLFASAYCVSPELDQFFAILDDQTQAHKVCHGFVGCVFFVCLCILSSPALSVWVFFCHVCLCICVFRGPCLFKINVVMDCIMFARYSLQSVFFTSKSLLPLSVLYYHSSIPFLQQKLVTLRVMKRLIQSDSSPIPKNKHKAVSSLVLSNNIPP